MMKCKWQVIAGGVLIGETSEFNSVDANRDDITHQRWELMSKAREQFPDAPFPGYTYKLVKADGAPFASGDIKGFKNETTV